LKTIIKRELLDQILSIQFAILLCFSIILFSFNGFVSVKRFNQQITSYNARNAETQQKPSTLYAFLYKQPSQLLFMSEGGDKYLPIGYSLRQKGAIAPMPSSAGNFKLPEVPEIDWVLIIKLVFSLYVILIGFNAISGEKEQGTLKQILSNSIGRGGVFVAKYIATLMSTLVPLLIGLFISLIIIMRFMPRGLILQNISGILVMLFLAICYLSIFIFLSLLASSIIIGRPPLVLLVLLVAWIIIVIIIPNLSGILSQSFSNARSEYQTSKMIAPLIQQQVWTKINKIRDRASKGEIKTEGELREETDGVYEDGQEELNKYYRDYENTIKQRFLFAQEMSRISPAALFQFASDNISQTGIKHDERFLRDVQNYAKTYDKYVLKKVGKLVGTSILSFSMDMAINGKVILVSSPFPKEYQGDKSDFPQFIESKPNLAESIKSSLFDIAGLILWNIILALGGFWAFFRADVR
jgi:ABC-type transport system involved in multi-copper enzyme maturation permease subunit